MPESARPTSDNPLTADLDDLHDLHDLPELEHDLEVVSWLVCSSQLGGEVTGYLCDALREWAVAGRGYPQMRLPDAGPDCDHLQELKVILDRIPQRIIDAETVAEKMDLGRFGRLLSRAFWASWDPQAVRESAERELLLALHLTGPPARYRLPGGGVL